MVRFKNRYMVFELMWKDGKVDETISASNTCSKEFLEPRKACMRCAALPPLHSTAVMPPADEGVLLSVVRESIQQNFGDYGLGSALASFQGGALWCAAAPLHAFAQPELVKFQQRFCPLQSSSTTQ